MVTADLLSRARAGDGEAFRELTGPHRRELQVHCYRMLGSFRRRGHRPGDDAGRLARHRRVPFPDALLEGAADVPSGPEARYEQTEAISLTFVTALQLLPPRQVAVLILRDVLGFHASEVAGMLEVTLESANSTLKRARASLQRRQPPAASRPRRPGSPAEDTIVARFTRAGESADLDALVALLTDDVFIAMPPVPLGYEGRDAVTRYCASVFAAGRRSDLVPVRANGQPAFGTYLRGPAGSRHATAFYVLTLAGGQICAITRFEASVLPWFGLPRSLPSR